MRWGWAGLGQLADSSEWKLALGAMVAYSTARECCAEANLRTRSTFSSSTWNSISLALPPFWHRHSQAGTTMNSLATSTSRRIAHRVSSTCTCRFASTARPPLASSAPKTPATTTGQGEAPSHYLVTLLRSPLHLPAKVKATVASLGLHKRLASVVVPVSPTNHGYLLKCKELVAVRPVSQQQIQEWASPEWSRRPGKGNQGSGVRIVEPAGPHSVIRIGSERARGDERGFRIINDS